MVEKEQNSTIWGTASLVCGILGLLLFIMPYFGIILSICAIVFYAIQKKKKQLTRATAGLVTGIIGCCINAFMFFILMIALAIGL